MLFYQILFVTLQYHQSVYLVRLVLNQKPTQ